MDISKLSALMSGNEVLVGKFIALFKEQIPLQLAQLRQFLSAGELEQASIMAHSIKSQCRYFDLDDIVTVCQSIEDNAADPETPSRLEELETRLHEVIQKI